MDDETLRRGQKVQAAAGKFGLQADSYVENEWDVHKGDTQLGKLFYFPLRCSRRPSGSAASRATPPGSARCCSSSS